MKVRRNTLGDEPLVSGLVDAPLSTKEILLILGRGGKIRHVKNGWVVWLEGSKLSSDKLTVVGAIPAIIFNEDIEWCESRETV